MHLLPRRARCFFPSSGCLHLRTSDLQQAQATEQAVQCAESPSTEPSPTTAKEKPARRPLPEHLPRDTQTHVPEQAACPDCSGKLRKLSEDVSEVLEYVPDSFQAPEVAHRRSTYLGTLTVRGREYRDFRTRTPLPVVTENPVGA